MAAEPRFASLRAQLVAFCRDEVEHRDDAAQRLHAPPGPVGRLWSAVVGVGSRTGVWVARRL
jgi:demethoxyubiquinone hydroxylase (CLK1/Coq7/Cat5 family)